jgi:hypothetical protein
MKRLPTSVLIFILILQGLTVGMQINMGHGDQATVGAFLMVAFAFQLYSRTDFKG